MKNVLITGGAGYIGSTLTPMLLKAGYDVTVLDSFMFRQDSLLDCCADKNFHIINADARDDETIAAAVKEKDYIIPLAALAGFPICNRDKTAATTTNLDAVRLILRLREKDTRVIFPCTNSGYGIGQGQSFCTEESPINPISLYGKTKLAAESAVLEAGNSVCFRFATLFGASPRMRTDLLVNDFVYRAVFDGCLVVFEGQYKRNYLHVRDAAGAFMFAMEHFGEMNGRTFNCGLSDSNISKLELCEKIKAHLPAFTYLEAPIGKDLDQRNYIVSNARLEGLGWRPSYSLDDGIDELVKAYSVIKNNRYSNV